VAGFDDLGAGEGLEGAFGAAGAVIEKRFRTEGSRWTDPKVHRLFFDPLSQVWYLPCRGLHPLPAGEVLEDDGAEVECGRCPRG
jgi:hypothetical protein